MLKDKLKKAFGVFIVIVILFVLGVIIESGDDRKSYVTENHKDVREELDIEIADNIYELYGLMRAHFIDVGQGDCVFIELGNGQTMLIDAGNSENGDEIVSYIQELQYSDINYVVATHPHDDHIGGMAEVLKNFEIEAMYMPNGGNILSTKKGDVYGKITIPSGEEYSLSNGNDVFVGWSDGKTVWVAGSTCTLTHNAHFYPVWNTSYKITFVKGERPGVTGEPAISEIWAVENQTITLSGQGTLDLSGHKFKGWRLGETLYPVGTSYVVPSENVEFVPEWEAAIYANFLPDATSVSGTVATIPAFRDEEITLPACTFNREGYMFDCWTINGTDEYMPGDTFQMGNSNVDFKAKWIKASAAIFKAPTQFYEGSIPSTIKNIPGETFTLPDNPYSITTNIGSYTFEGWNDGVKTWNAGEVYTFTNNDVTFTPVFKYVGETKTVKPLAAATVERVWNEATSTYNYTIVDRSGASSYVNIITPIKKYSNGASDGRYIAFKIDLKNIGTITEASLSLTTAKIDNGGNLRAYESGNMTWENLLSGAAEPLCGNMIVSIESKASSSAKTSILDIKSYLAARQQAGAEYAIVYVAQEGAGNPRGNYEGGFRLYQLKNSKYAPTLTITTASN